MKAAVLQANAQIESHPLIITEVARPTADPNELLV